MRDMLCFLLNYLYQRKLNLNRDISNAIAAFIFISYVANSVAPIFAFVQQPTWRNMKLVFKYSGKIAVVLKAQTFGNFL